MKLIMEQRKIPSSLWFGELIAFSELKGKVKAEYCVKFLSYLSMAFFDFVEYLLTVSEQPCVVVLAKSAVTHGILANAHSK